MLKEIGYLDDFHHDIPKVLNYNVGYKRSYKQPTVYIGASIDQAEDPKAVFESLTEVVISSIPNAVVFNPLTAYNNAHQAETDEACNFIVAINTMATVMADIGVFVWKNAPSFGMPLEIEYFARKKKPLFIVNLSGKKPGIYMRHYIMMAGGTIVDSYGDLQRRLALFTFDPTTSKE